MGKGIMKKMSRKQQQAVGASMNEGAGKMAKDSAGYMAKDSAGYMSHKGGSGKKEPIGKMSRELTYGGPVIDQMGNALSHMGAHKVLKHMKSKF
tara:strand:+ start:887 stop:1168 length:282 start_codon:yes stop_codon:yes gene_type:complete